MKKGKFLPVIVSLLAVAVSFGACTSSKIDVHPRNVIDSLDDAKIEAKLGDIVEIPDFVFKKDGKTYPSTKIIVFPDGSEKMADMIEATLPGQYKVIYTATIEGVVHSDELPFFVDFPQYRVNNLAASSINYIKSPQSAGIPAETPGALVSLAFGDTLTFTQTIPVEDLKSQNTLLKLYVVPSNMGSSDFSQLTLTLANPEDPSNYLKITYFSHTETNSDGSVAHSSSVCARSDAVNFFAGMHQTQGLHTNDKYGMWSGCTFDGYIQPSYKSEFIDNCMFCFGFDNTTKTCYGTGFLRGESGEPCLDLDDPEQVNKIWGGFTSDRVQMSISCDLYSGSTANFVITEALNVNPDLFEKNLFYDEEGPNISLLDDKPMPNGAVGYTYPVPEAVAYDDVCLACPVETNVYLNYSPEKDDNTSSVKIVDGRFKMDTVGVYSIVYTSKDYAGNVGTLVKSISVLSTIKKPEFDLPKIPTQADVGSYIALDDNITVKSYCGDTTLKMYYESNTTPKTEVIEGFRIAKLEDYKVTYEVSDLIGQTTEKSATIKVINNGKPILENTPVFPKYLLSKGLYKAPDLSVLLYENGQLVRKEGSLKVTFNGTEKIVKSFEEYQPIIVNNKDNTDFDILYNGNSLYKSQVTTIQGKGERYGTETLLLENYFITSSGDMFLRPNAGRMYPDEPGRKDEERGAYYTAKNGSIEFDFANFISLDNFSIKLNKFLELKNGTTAKITLTDAGNLNNSISAYVSYENSKTYFAVNDVKVLTLDNAMDPYSFTRMVQVTYSQGIFTYNNDTSIPVLKLDSGKSFKGFKSEYAYISIEITDCGEKTNVLVDSISGNVITSQSSFDRTEPVIYSDYEIGGTCNINDIYVYRPYKAYDVLSPNVVFTLSVLNEKGEYAKDTDGNTLQEVDASVSHSIKLENYGMYTFTLTAKEDSRFLPDYNQYSISRTIHVYDKIKPTINMQEQFAETYNVNTTVRFPKFTYSDNYTPTEKLVVQRLYIDPNGKYTYLSDSDTTIKFSITGVYKVMINVMDEYGNISNVTMYVMVK